jgi:hypothetical protein
VVSSGLRVRAGLGIRRLRARVGSEALGVCGFGLVSVQGSEWVSGFVTGSAVGVNFD